MKLEKIAYMIPGGGGEDPPPPPSGTGNDGKEEVTEP